jgi:hypothetical protein
VAPIHIKQAHRYEGASSALG